MKWVNIRKLLNLWPNCNTYGSKTQGTEKKFFNLADGFEDSR